MDKQLHEFLTEKCMFKDDKLADIIQKFQEGELNSIEQLLMLEDNLEGNLKDFGLKVMQIKTICLKFKQFKSLYAGGPQNANPIQENSDKQIKQGPQIDEPVMLKGENPLANEVEMADKPEAAVKEIKKPKPAADYAKLEEVKEIAIGHEMIVQEPIDISKQKGIYTLFQTFEDSSSEYKMKKIRLNESDFLEFFEGLKDIRVEIVAFFGDFNRSMDLAEAFIQRRVSRAILLDEGLVAITNKQRIALVYKTNFEIYDFKTEVDSNNLAVTYLRYLLDTCHDIFAVQPSTQTFNKHSENPYKEYMNPGFEIKEMIVEPDDKISVEEIKLSSDKINQLDEIKAYKGYLDFQKFIVKPSFDLIHNKQDLYHSTKLTEKYEYKKVTYSEVKEHIFKEWPKTNLYFNNQYYKRHLTTELKNILSPFIKQISYEQFCQKSLELTQIYEEMYQEILSEVNQLIQNSKLDVSHCLNDFISDVNCDKIEELANKKALKDLESKGVFKQAISYFSGSKTADEEYKCTYQCQRFNNLRSYHDLKQYTCINWDYVAKTHLNTFIHKTKIVQLKNLAKDFQEKLQKFIREQEKVKEVKIIKLRQKILEQLFDSIKDMIQTSKLEVINKYEISFSSINIIRNEKHDVTNWNLIKYPINLQGQFSKESTGDVTLKSLLFINETTGIILFRNTPLEKSSIFYFNISNKGSPIISLKQTFSSKDKQIIMEPNFKQLLMYDNVQRIAHLMKISNQGAIEGETQIQVYDVVSEGFNGLTIKSIKSACFLPYGDKFFILSEESNFFEYRMSSRKLFNITKRIQEDSKIIISQIKPQAEDDKYQEIQVLADGKSIILISLQSIDIYDLNYDKITSFPKTNDYEFLKCYNDKLNNFLFIFSRSSTKCYQIKGLSAVKHYESQITSQNKQSKQLGNPIFDYIYQSVKKFGPHSSFLGCPQDTQLTFIYHDQELNKQIIKKYFQFLQLQDVALVSKLLQKDANYFDHIDSTVAIKDLKMILLGRVAIHIATIENFTLVPLQNGQNISEQIAQNFIQNRDQMQNFIQRIKELIKFGIYEKVFEDHKTPLIVISIVGKQSSGKSYVMNRFFGTRFNVAATRCTDGIWMSIVRTNHNGKDQVFVVLDCEGLFSARRNETEEMKLCLALSAVSDIMILNQDLSFNRYLNVLFNNFSKCIGRINGKQLFKGCLMMLIRDVKSDEATSAYHELQSNLLQLQQNDQDKFLSACFQGKLLAQCLNYFSQPKFNDEIAYVREKYFFSMNASRWKNGTDFADSLKIALAQIFSDDDSDIDIYMIKIQCEKAYIECLNMFYEGSERFETEGGILQLELEIAEQKYNVMFRQSQFKINFPEEILTHENQDKLLYILQEFQNQTTYIQNINHNSYKKALNQFYDAFLDQRMKFVLDYFNQNFNEGEEFVDTIKTFEYQLKKEIESTISKLRYCQRTCRDCKRICSKNQDHRNDCDCETGHICEHKCSITPDCEKGGYLCVEKFGHEGDHRCSIGNHKCTTICEIKSCKFICSQNFGHLDTLNHNCGNKHPCSEKCEDEACERTCQHDFMNEHEQHHCGSIRCFHKCGLCDDNCTSQNHLHNKAIKDNNKEGMIHYDEDGGEIELQYHMCSTTHNCKKQCTEKGICNITFNYEEKIWENEFGSYEYRQVIPVAEKIQCKIFIDKFHIDHEESHDCKQVHRCPEQCPECQSFCNKDYGHDGLHSSKAHRNKENCVFVSTKDVESKIVIEDDKKKREYKVGDSCQPESCDRSCHRKGRSHYHIKECKGADACEAKLYPYVRHSTMKFEPFNTKIFDMWLCINYWNSMNWEPPVNGGELALIQQCNYICGHYSHGSEQSFCTKGSWHTENHHFSCVHKLDSSVMDIVFCMDTTGSMASYIENSKKTVTKLMNLFNVGGRSIKFGFVAYKDHPPQDTTYITREQDLTDQVTCQTFINSLTADGGGDSPEAVLDGLFVSTTKMTWRKDSMRFIFHIGDAPPHGKLYVSSGDGFPDGCPCNYTIETIASRMEANKIKYRQLKISTYTNLMSQVFKKHIKDYIEIEIESASQLEVKMSEIIAREIETDEIDFIK